MKENVQNSQLKTNVQLISIYKVSLANSMLGCQTSQQNMSQLLSCSFYAFSYFYLLAVLDYHHLTITQIV